MIKEGAGHHPHSLRNAKPIADFISEQVQPAGTNPPPYLSGRITKSSIYGRQNVYRYAPSEGIYITCRGPWFSPSFDRYSFGMTGVEGSISVIVPKTIAAGKPWVFRADYVTSRCKGRPGSTRTRVSHRDGAQCRTTRTGRHSRAGMPSTNCSPSTGFQRSPCSKEPAARREKPMPGPSRIPSKVSCIYGENPVLRCTMTKTQPLDNLAPAREGRHSRATRVRQS